LLPASLSSVHDGRRFVRATLQSWVGNHGADSWIDDIVLVTSELVANAVVHAQTVVQLRLCCREGAFRVEVGDTSDEHPMLRTADHEAPSGRGMALVAALARSWGSDDCSPGKVVWAQFELSEGLEALAS